MGYTVVNLSTVIATHLTEILRRFAHELLTRQETQKLLDSVSKKSPKIIEGVITDPLNLGQIQKVLQNLLRERVSIRDLLTILETLADRASVTKSADILMGMTSRYNLSHVLRDEKTLDEVIAEGPSGIHVLPAASGMEWMANLTGEQRVTFLQKMDALNGRYDILLLDTGAGISSNVTYFNLAAQTRIVIVTPEPTSLTDAYALIKVLHQSHRLRDFEVVVNSVQGEKEALEVYRSLTTVADRFLDVRLGYLGCIERDEHVRQAVLQQKPVVLLYPHGGVARSCRAIAQRIAQLPVEVMGNELGLFWRKMVEKAPV
jgi:flagellar biosynthesis protein FlhG